MKDLEPGKKLLAKIRAKLNPPVEAVDDAATLARIMDDLDRTHARLLASGMTPPTPAQLEQSREFDAMFPAGAGCW